MTVNRNLTVHNMLITRGILKMVSNVSGEVDEVREEGLRRRECDRLKRKRETNEKRHTRLVNLCPRLSLLIIHISVMALHKANDRKNRRAEQYEELREGVSPLLQSIVAIALQYSYSIR